jgi:hypothetical protein
MRAAGRRAGDEQQTGSAEDEAGNGGQNQRMRGLT